MDRAQESVQRAADSLYKTHYGSLLAALLQYLRGLPLEAAEDLVHDSFAAALSSWEKEGIPDNPAGWIFTVSKNKALNLLKKTKRVSPHFSYEEYYVSDPGFRESVFTDQSLKLLFACAHPDLSPKVQVVITLKYVVNLKVEAIAKVLGMSIDGIDKLLLRARQKIKNENILLKEPGLHALASRLPIVHKIIYLLFNEGYKPSSGKELLNEALCEEALLLNKALLDSGFGDTATAALHALMLFNASRFSTRFGTAGEILDLEEQDRNLWNKPLISLACDFFKQSTCDTQPVITTYHYEASIAFLHCTAKSFFATNWVLISSLYQKLLQVNPNPFVELNYSISLYFAGQKDQALDLLHSLQQHPFLNSYYLLNAALGKIYLLEGNAGKAKVFFLKTLEQTNSEIEKDFIRRLLKKTESLCRGRG